MDSVTDESSRERVRRFIRLDNLDKRLRTKNTIAIELQNTKKQWRRGRFVVSRRDDNGRAIHVMWLTEDIDNEKQQRDKLIDMSERAIAYYRYSSHSQNEASIEQQQEAAHKYADAHGLNIIKEYEDRAASGTTADRDGYQNMLAELDKYKPSALILWKADRLGRDR